MRVRIRHRERRPASFYWLALLFGLFVLFLYGPVITIFILSFQGPQGGLTFPMRGVSLHWFAVLRDGVGDVDIWPAFGRSVKLALAVTVLTVLFSVSAGLAFRRRFRGDTTVFYVSVASLIMPSIIVSLGIGLTFRLLDTLIRYLANEWGFQSFADGWTTSMGLYTSALGAHLTWTLPFGLLVMFAVFNRFSPAFEEAARDLGASPWQSFRHVVLPIIGPSVIGIAMFGFTLSWDEIARTSQAIGDQNTLPLELQGLTTSVTTPVIYALGTMTTLISLAVMVGGLLIARSIARKRATTA
ncbi:ABC transporter permease [Paraburkholderia phymatum]|uniref:Binding-protein-dependent transport systems inner membrane component n=1 Tax=Paraburkholderia phymatum (strain DSM 17167 / CIP 108236 / LMG 21445 / STM815) TaxID=391038 RepID=B2JVI7_PARP8|nr:ABC transporter permease [Paraburkholderia phymatum]ACC74964.1 binding-protein-dependent transport systems inner membrane component [Paraburkholderia phymatum STM815]